LYCSTCSDGGTIVQAWQRIVGLLNQQNSWRDSTRANRDILPNGCRIDASITIKRDSRLGVRISLATAILAHLQVRNGQVLVATSSMSCSLTVALDDRFSLGCADLALCSRMMNLGASFSDTATSGSILPTIAPTRATRNSSYCTSRT